MHETFDELWPKVSAFAGMIARRYQAAAERNGGVDFDDLHQLAAIGVWEASKSFDHSQGSFASWAAYHIRAQIRRGLGLDGRQRIENGDTVSLDAPLPADEDLTLLDTLRNDSAIAPQEAAELADLQRIVREAVEALPSDEREAVRLHGLQGIPFSQIAQEKGEEAHKIKNRFSHGCMNLRRQNNMRQLAESFAYGYSLSRFKSSFTSSVEAAVMRRDALD